MDMDMDMDMDMEGRLFWEYAAVKTPPGFICKFCSKQYHDELNKATIERHLRHLAKLESDDDADHCLLVPRYVQNLWRQMLQLIRKRYSISEDDIRSTIGVHLSASDLQSTSKRPRTAVANVKTLGVHLLTAEIVGKQFHKYIKDIWSCLMYDDDDLLRIGIHGTAGVGKTEVSKSINNMLLQIPNKFHHVFWVNMSSDWSIWSGASVSQFPTVRHLQSCISKAVGADLSDEDNEHKRAAHLSKFFAEKKKSLLILDDVWDYISLQEVGIPVAVDGCIVLFTTRSSVLCRQLGCQRKIEIRRLPPHYNYELLKNNLGKETIPTLSREVKEISMLLADKCVGLPQYILSTIGVHLSAASEIVGRQFDDTEYYIMIFTNE